MPNEIKPEQVPKIVVEAAVSTWLNSDGTVRQDITKVIAAALSAWPGMDMQNEDWERWKLPFPLIILPLTTQENGDE